MYHHILVPLENSEADLTILAHIRSLARLTHAEILLLHVADGWAARHYNELQLQESEEMRKDKAYLAEVGAALRKEGFVVTELLALGNPADEIVRIAHEGKIDLIAMSSHGHRFLADLVLGSTAEQVRHEVEVPVLFLRARSHAPA